MTRWTEEELEHLRDIASRHTVHELAGLFGRNYSAMYQTLRKYKIVPKLGKRGRPSRRNLSSFSGEDAGLSVVDEDSRLGPWTIGSNI